MRIESMQHGLKTIQYQPIDVSGITATQSEANGGRSGGMTPCPAVEESFFRGVYGRNRKKDQLA